MRATLLAAMLIFAAGGVSPASAQGAAEGAVVVPYQKMQILHLPRDAASVIVGDPSVAVVTVEDPRTLYLFGRAAGETNLVIFDANKQLIMDRPLAVRGGTGSVTVFTPAAAGAGMEPTVYNCSDKCARATATGGGAAAGVSVSGAGGGTVTSDTPVTQ